MKLSAVRGYSAYADEKEVGILMDKMLELLKKYQKKLRMIIRNMNA